MLRILDRYILREVVVSWLAVTGVLLAILLTNQVARVLERAAESQYPRGVVLELILLSAVQNLSLVVPVGLLLGIVLALGRLYHDSEMTAAQACGAGSRPVLVPVLGFTAVLALAAGGAVACTWRRPPRAACSSCAARRCAPASSRPSRAGRFRMFGGGSTVVYAQGADPDGTLQRVFVERDRGGHLEIALAQRATHAYAEDGDLQVITLYDGERFEGIPGERRFRIVRFAENTIPVRLPALSAGAVALEGAPTRSLLQSHDRAQARRIPLAHRVSRSWRWCWPASRIPLARLRPRQGRYARVGYAVLIFFVYINLAIAGRQWLARGVIPQWLGLWWVHAAVVLLAARHPADSALARACCAIAATCAAPARGAAVPA